MEFTNEKIDVVFIQWTVLWLMGRRVTIMIEDNLDKKIRQFQSKMMQKENATYSYSKAVNVLLKKSL